ncbi:hypothetical protein L6452_27997 [Arctium lappa]|uniref:Uncharacterized protein n=1 Tax=Arctium lappa TaxID=4217 RepID=A0ACB8ZY37_ARCLA|nr:hypothetical protein L6452_27997 [Arctium lappa]
MFMQYSTTTKPATFLAIMSFSMNHLIAYFLLFLIPYAASLSFDLTNIGQRNQNLEIVIEDDAYISDNGIQNNSVIAPGGAMGLPFNQTTMVALSPFVAVEFDTFWNQWDPRDSSNRSVGEHVGISISSPASERSQKWLSNVTGGAECQAWVTYDSVSKNLSVSFTGFRNSTVVRQAGLHYIIDLRGVLPDRVIFGFSAATGVYFQTNNVKSWTFNSMDLQIDEDRRLPVDDNNNSRPPAENPISNPVGDKNNMVGIIVGLPVSITFLAVVVFVLWRKKRKNKEYEAEELEFDAEMNNEFQMDLRPSIRQAIQVLNSEASLPILPLKMPVASYLSLPISSLHGVVSIVQNQFSSSNDNTDSSKQTATTSSTASSASPSVSLLHSMQ